MVASREARLERITELEVELGGLNGEREQHEIERADIQTQVAELQDERRRLEDELAAAREVALGLATGLAEHRNRLAQLEEREAELVREDVEHEEAIDDLKHQLDALAAKIRAAEAERDAVIAKLEQLTAEELEKRRVEEASMQRQDELRARRDELRRALSELETRYELLSKLRGELADYPQGPRTVLGHREELSGIVGTVADLLEVPSQLEKAVEAALGNSLQGIVVTTWRDAEAALRLLKEKEAGRATFIPLDSLDMEVPSDVPKSEGVVGRASELVATRTGLDEFRELFWATPWWLMIWTRRAPSTRIAVACTWSLWQASSCHATVSFGAVSPALEADCWAGNASDASCRSRSGPSALTWRDWNRNWSKRRRFNNPWRISWEQSSRRRDLWSEL